MKNNHNDHGRRLEFLEKVYREDRERWQKHEAKFEEESKKREEESKKRDEESKKRDEESKKNDERWKAHYHQVNLMLGLIRDQGKRTDGLVQEVKRQGDRLDRVIRRHHRKSEFPEDEA